MQEANPASLVPVVAWGAFALAFVFGFVGNRTNFCTMGAVSDIVNRRLLSFCRRSLTNTILLPSGE